MKKHTIYEGEIIVNLTGLEMAHSIALEHHERWDGTGYPNGLKEKESSLAARIVAIADVFDASFQNELTKKILVIKRQKKYLK